MLEKIKKSDALRVSAITLVVNFILCVAKFVAGILGNSGAMISDAVHSASDVLSTLVVMAGVNISERDSDIDHQYGHERMECIAAMFLSAVLFLTGAAIGIDGIMNIINAEYTTMPLPTGIALVAAVLSVVVKEWMYHYTKKTAKKINSSAMLADAWHHRSDALSSIGSFVGILGAMLGFMILDSLAMIVIAGMIIKASFDIAIDSVDKLVDKAVDGETLDKIKNVATAVQGVHAVDLVRTRMFGSKFYVDIEICCDGELSLKAAHEIAETVHEKVEESFPMAKHCMVHVNPYIS